MMMIAFFMIDITNMSRFVLPSPFSHALGTFVANGTMMMFADLPLPTVSTVEDLHETVMTWRQSGLRVGFVPTMGALHAGHISLVHTALENADRVVASIFVNPAQFAPNEDFDSYPRTMKTDAEMLSGAGCHLLYAPDPAVIYPDGFATSISVNGPGLELESAARPHFFSGVATVVTKLLNQVQPDVAAFGEKDYQQLLVIRRLVQDLDMNIEIIGGPTLREEDGLAMSSRNANLSASDRERAGRLNIILRDLAEALMDGEAIPAALTHARNLAFEAFDQVDYLEVRDAKTLQAIKSETVKVPARVLAAVRVGKTRLIDNMAVDVR